MKLIWLREDLRISDNPALYHAAENDSVACVYIITPILFEKHDVSAHKVNFLMAGLRQLQAELKKRNIALNILTVEDPKAIKQALVSYAKVIKAEAIYFNRQYEANEQKRDQVVIEYCEDFNIAVKTFNDQCLFEPGQVLTLSKQFFQIYTPFKKACWKLLQREGLPKPLGPPKKQPQMIGVASTLPTFIGKHEIKEPLINAGERFAQQQLKQFVEHKILYYKELRDFPAKDATSRLSPYFSAGMITVHQCFDLIHSWQQQEHKKSFFELAEGPLTWSNELLWREFYRHILVGFPRVSKHRPFKLNTDRIQWIQNNELLQAWQQGLTGVPIVDAAMRQLNQTGWMHNRLRMVVAMYFSKNLFLNWRLGEKYFMQNLIDGDLASNNGGWQWSASTGVDAAPYFRIFNPYRQSERFDPQGEFIRQYLPELEALDSKSIHTAQTNKKLSYPNPIVDVQQSKKCAIAAFKELNS